MNRLTRLCVVSMFACGIAAVAQAQATVHVTPFQLSGPRVLQEQTRAAVIRDYVESWSSLSQALAQNQPGLLDAEFVGDARERLGDTVRQQATAGIKSVYQDVSHDLKIVFYSPEGLSVELTDKVEFDIKVYDHEKLVGTRHVSTHYLAVLTPSEVRWRVRVFQSAAE